MWPSNSCLAAAAIQIQIIVAAHCEIAAAAAVAIEDDGCLLQHLMIQCCNSVLANLRKQQLLRDNSNIIFSGLCFDAEATQLRPRSADVELINHQLLAVLLSGLHTGSSSSSTFHGQRHFNNITHAERLLFKCQQLINNAACICI